MHSRAAKTAQRNPSSSVSSNTCVTARLRIVGTKCLRRNTSRTEGFFQAPGLWSQGRRDGRNSFGPWQREWPGACSHLGRSGSKDKGIAGARLAVSLSFIILGEPHSGDVSLLSSTLTDTPSLLCDFKPSRLTVMGSSSQVICPH